MTPELLKTIKDRWSEIGVFVLAVVGFVLEHWDLAGPRVSAIWEHVWPIMAAYVAFRIFQFGRSLYQRFTRLEARSVSFETEARNGLEAEAKSRIAGDTNTSQTVNLELKTLRDALREEFSQRQKLEGQVAELKERLSLLTEREPSPAELLATSVRTGSKGIGAIQRSPKSLADMLTPGMLLTSQGTKTSRLFGLDENNRPDPKPSKHNI